MFGWLAHAFAPVCPDHDTATSSISRCAVWMSGPELMSRLPLLGGVLYLRSRPLELHALPAPNGWLVARRELAPLLRTRQLIASSMIGRDGPREWIDCMDALGRPCARLHLLPDTDYLAWDALLARGRAMPPATPRHERISWRAASAELLYFRRRWLGALQLLEADPLVRVSPLGKSIAHDVARAASVELEPALV